MPAAVDSCSAPRTAVVEPVRAQRHGVIEEGTRVKIAADDPCDLPPREVRGTNCRWRVRCVPEDVRGSGAAVKQAGSRWPPPRARPASGVPCPEVPSYQCPAPSVRCVDVRDPDQLRVHEFIDDRGCRSEDPF